MLIRMVRSRALQDAGQERPLDVGGVYDLPDGVAAALLATGAAVHVAPAETRERAAIEAPENGTRRVRRKRAS